MGTVGVGDKLLDAGRCRRLLLFPFAFSRGDMVSSETIRRIRMKKMMLPLSTYSRRG